MIYIQQDSPISAQIDYCGTTSKLPFPLEMIPIRAINQSGDFIAKWMNSIEFFSVLLPFPCLEIRQSGPQII